MASPRVFVSSTCFDLAEVRDSLVSFCQGFGFEVAMSENGDVFYHPDLHTHESCISEISNCQLFILIIGGRFGGKYKVDPSKSITNAEYNAAKENGIPVFTFVKDNVLADHHVFQKNKNKSFASDILYPSIENQSHADKIFNFIDAVRGSNVNNGFFDFKYARDLHVSLRKQWAGMFFEFLVNRNVSNQLKSTNDSIANLSIASKKIEELIKNIYRQVDEVGANESIIAIDAESEASKFFLEIGRLINTHQFVPLNKIEYLVDNVIENWWEFLEGMGDFENFRDIYSDKGGSTDAVFYVPNAEYPPEYVADYSGDLTESENLMSKKLEVTYDAFKKLSKESKKKILHKYDEIPF